MTTSQPNPLELAKQGDVRAIAFLMNRSLKPKGITAKTAFKDCCLQVMLEAPEIPDQRTLASFIHKGVIGLEIASIRKLRVYGRKIGNESPAWSQEFDLSQTAAPLSNVEVEHQSEQLNISQISNSQKNSVQALTQTKPIEQLKVKEQVLLECKGENGILVLTDTKVTIKRNGGFLSPHKKGEKHIDYKDIINFYYHKSNLFSPGYIYFQLQGLPKEINFFEANSIESAVTFLNEKIQDFDKAKEILVKKISPQKSDNMFEGRNSATNSAISSVTENIKDFDKDNKFLIKKVDYEESNNVFEGRSGTLILTETGVIIKRDGGLFSNHPASEKTIPYRSITAVQFKKADLTVGFIQFTLQGGVEAKRGAFEAVTDENTVTFGTEEKTKEFERAKSIIEQKISMANIAASSVSNSSNDLEQLEKLASLRDKGIISEEEFQAKKKKILDL
jgi:hypothetical protein